MKISDISIILSWREDKRLKSRSFEHFDDAVSFAKGMTILPDITDIKLIDLRCYTFSKEVKK